MDVKFPRTCMPLAAGPGLSFAVMVARTEKRPVPGLWGPSVPIPAHTENRPVAPPPHTNETSVGVPLDDGWLPEDEDVPDDESPLVPLEPGSPLDAGVSPEDETTTVPPELLWLSLDVGASPEEEITTVPPELLCWPLEAGMSPEDETTVSPELLCMPLDAGLSPDEETTIPPDVLGTPLEASACEDEPCSPELEDRDADPLLAPLELLPWEVADAPDDDVNPPDELDELCSLGSHSPVLVSHCSSSAQSSSDVHSFCGQAGQPASTAASPAATLHLTNPLIMSSFQQWPHDSPTR